MPRTGATVVQCGMRIVKAFSAAAAAPSGSSVPKPIGLDGALECGRLGVQRGGPVAGLDAALDDPDQALEHRRVDAGLVEAGGEQRDPDGVVGRWKRSPLATAVPTSSSVLPRPARSEPVRRANASSSASTWRAAAPCASGPASAAAAAATAAAVRRSSPARCRSRRRCGWPSAWPRAAPSGPGARTRRRCDATTTAASPRGCPRSAERADRPRVDPFGDVPARQRAERRHESGGAHEDAGPVLDLRPVLGDRGGQFRGGARRRRRGRSGGTRVRRRRRL